MVYHIKLYNGFVYPEFLTSPLSSSEIEPGAGVGKSCLLLRFADDTYTEPMGKTPWEKSLNWWEFGLGNPPKNGFAIWKFNEIHRCYIYSCEVNRSEWLVLASEIGAFLS